MPLTLLDANQRIWNRDQDEMKRDLTRAFRDSAKQSVSTPQRLDENANFEDLKGFEVGKSGEPLFGIDIEGMILKAQSM